MQFRRILVPVDFRDRDTRAVRVAHDVAAASGGETTLLHVIETLEDASFEELADFYERLEEKARIGIEQLVKATGIEPPRSEIRYGKRARVIVDFAREEMVDLIVLSSHSVDEEQALRAWSTLSYTVALLAPCAVLLVK